MLPSVMGYHFGQALTFLLLFAFQSECENPLCFALLQSLASYTSLSLLLQTIYSLEENLKSFSFFFININNKEVG